MKKNFIMIKKKTIIADAKRCLMCYQPICDIACQEKVFPAGIIHALHLKNEAGAGLRLAGNASCLHCGLCTLVCPTEAMSLVNSL